MSRSLPRQSEHEIQIDTVETGTLCFGKCVFNLFGSMYAAKRFQALRREALRTDRKPVHTSFAISGETAVLDCSRVCFHRYLTSFGKRQIIPAGIQNSSDVIRTEQTWRTATEKNALDRSIAGLRPFEREIREQRGDVSPIRRLICGFVRVEITIGDTSAHTRAGECTATAAAKDVASVLPFSVSQNITEHPEGLATMTHGVFFFTAHFCARLLRVNVKEDRIVSKAAISPAFAQNPPAPNLFHDEWFPGIAGKHQHCCTMKATAAFRVRNRVEFLQQQVEIFFIGRVFASVARRTDARAPVSASTAIPESSAIAGRPECSMA